LPVYQTYSGPRLPYFLEKVSDTSCPRLPVFGGTLQERFRSDLSPQRKNFNHFARKFLFSATVLKVLNLVVPDKSEKFPGS
jgi:hypothetical protein